MKLPMSRTGATGKSLQSDICDKQVEINCFLSLSELLCLTCNLSIPLKTACVDFVVFFCLFWRFESVILDHCFRG